MSESEQVPNEWEKYIALDWAAQQRIEAAYPEGVRELERRWRRNLEHRPGSEGPHGRAALEAWERERGGTK